MFYLFSKSRIKLRTSGIIVFVAVLLTAAFGLWAENPGPKADRSVRVESFRPTGLTDRAVNITIKFSNSLVSPDSLNRPARDIPVQIRPDIDALARWTATDQLTIYPGQPLSPATEYRVTIRRGGGFVNGNAIRQNEDFSFHTPPLSVRVVHYQAQRTRERNRKARIVCDLDFNYPVNRQQLRRALRIKGQKGASRSRLPVIWPDTNLDGTPLPTEARHFRLSSELFDLQDERQLYKLIIDRNLDCVGCGNGLAESYTYTMEVTRNPYLDLRVQEVRAERAGKQGAILLQFSSRVPIEEVREHISIEPAIPFSVEGGWRGARLRGNFAPRTNYTVFIAPGIMSTNGELMDKEFSGRVIMGDLKPAIRFSSPGLYLPRDGSQLLEISTVNIDTLAIEVSQVFGNNLVTYMATGTDRRGGSYRGRGNDAYGRTTFVKDFPLKSIKNEELLSTIDLGEIVGDSLQGVFIVSARSKRARWTYDSRHVMITDIGAMARMSDQYLMVWANSLSKTKAIGKADVKLFSRNNQLLLEGKTNSRGVVVFADIADQIKGYRPFVITVAKGGDLAYLRLDNSRLSTSDFDVSGRPYLSDGYEAFIYFDRGVFRPGETAHLVSMVRGRDGVLPGSFPYLVKITGSRGRVLREYRMNADQSMSGIDIELPKDVPTGKYRATAYLSDDYVLGQSDFLVEDFIPDRIKIVVETDRADYLAGDTMIISVNANMLYGAPAAGLKVTSQLQLSPIEFKPDGYSSYSFGVRGTRASVKNITLGDTHLSDSGLITLRHLIAADHRPPSSLSAQVWASVSEASGRAVSSYVEAKIHPYRKYVGIKTTLEGYAKVGGPVSADIVVVQPDGAAAVSDSVLVTFARMVYNSMLVHQPDGSYRFVSEQTMEPVDSLWVKAGPGKATVSFTPMDYGRYRIMATDAIFGHAAAVDFYASGWGRVPWSMEEPDRLQLDLDQPEYEPGSRAKLQVRSPFGGRLLVTVENQTVQDYMVLDLPENTAEIELPVKREYSPNVYISATLIRPAGEVGKRTPARAYGIIPLKVRPDERHLAVTITNPDEIRPNSELLLDVHTTGSNRTQLTVAAIDAGILQLTNFGTPAPFEFFYGKRRPALYGYDLYSLIYPETEKAGSHLSPPGGVSNFRSKRHLNPFQARRINVVALWSGVVDVDSTGAARVDFKVPQFNGQLVILVVAADGDRFGSSSATTLVREPIILQEGFPRFIAPGDDVRALVTVFNGLDSAATIEVRAEIDGEAELLVDEPQLIRLERGKQGVVRFPIKAASAPGKVDVRLSASAGGESTQVSFELSNRLGNPLTTRFGSGAVTDDSAVVFMIPGDWVPGTAEFVLRTSSLSALQMTRNIEYLLRYPYGCVEQTTSALFPLLYFEDLAEIVRPELLGGNSHEYFIAEGIDKLLRFQRDNGAFTYWPGAERIHNWSSIYAAHFLIEANLAGYEIDKSGYKKTLRFLEDIARERNFRDIKTEHRIYACLALAKAGKLDRKLFNFLSGLNALELPRYAAYQMALTLALAGDVARAKEIVPIDIQPDLTKPESGGNFSSGVRSDAILLELLMSIDPESPSTAVVARSLLERARINRWYNTQATAFGLMALGKYFRQIEPAAFTGTIHVERGDDFLIDTSDFMLVDDQLGGRKISISIDGQGPCFYYWQASGVPLSSETLEYERGIVVRRTYLDEKGVPVNLANIPLGARLVGHITIRSNDKALNNVVIADLLPAAFEIENRRLAGSPQMPWLPPNLARSEYQDIRDDRMLMFVHVPQGRTLHFYYGLRAIAAGDFVVPPVAAECMYNPLIAGAGSSGRVTVTEPGN